MTFPVGASYEPVNESKLIRNHRDTEDTEAQRKRRSSQILLRRFFSVPLCLCGSYVVAISNVLLFRWALKLQGIQRLSGSLQFGTCSGQLLLDLADLRQGALLGRGIGHGGVNL